MWIQNNGYNKCTGHKKVRPRLPGSWDKALDLFQIISAVLEPKILFSIAMSVAEATAVNPNGTNKTLS